MKRKLMIITILSLILLITLTAVSAENNDTATLTQDANGADMLEKSYYIDEDGESYEDDTVVTHNVVKYYGDTDTKFKVKVYDDDYNPIGGVYVSFSVDFESYKQKVTNDKGIVYFPLNYKLGTYYVETNIDSEDGCSSWYAENTVKIKSTIPVKELVKYSTSKKKFKIKFLDSKGKKLINTPVKIKKNGKWYKLKTDNNGYVKIKSTFKTGKTKITAYNPVSKEKKNIPVVVLKRGVHKVNVKFIISDTAIGSKKLKNGDCIDTVYETKYRQYNPGVYVEATGGGLSLAKHTKLLKAKYYFKNKNTGKIITRTSSKVKYEGIVIKPISGYVPYKATVWYKDRI